MAFKVQVGPPQIAIHQGMTVLVTESDGQIADRSDKGLYFLDTRVISTWAVYANGEGWDLLNGGSTTYDIARIFLINRAFQTEDGPVEPRTLAFAITRVIDGGMREELSIANHGGRAVRFNLEISIRSDFADIFDIKSNRMLRRGRIATEWVEAERRLTTRYRNGAFARAIAVTVVGAAASYANGRLSFEVRLDPGAAWTACLHYDLSDGSLTQTAPDTPAADRPDPVASWAGAVLKMQTSNEEFYRLFRQSVDDMAALRLPIATLDRAAFVPAAGLPWFMAPFGRDSLIVSLQNILVYPEFAQGALRFLAKHQAAARDDARDAEPGKIMHELRYGELAHFRLIPHTPYYGTADATPLFLITLHAAWMASGDRALLEEFLPAAEAALDWIDHWGDRDGDGFQEYQTRSPSGYENMGWKDSGDGIVHPDGTLVKGPKALCELQGYVYDAWLRMASVYQALDRPDRADALRAKAAALFQRFNDVFWDEASGFYALTLDGTKQPVHSVASNQGHLLWSGIVPPERAARVVSRLMAPDMNSGWGLRTLSSAHAAYNPYSYQKGSVWPHDNSLIALGCKRYGFAREAAAIARDISEAASHFQQNQLPELYAGIGRQAGGFPVQYLGANVPQAWAAGTSFALLQAILGIRPDAPNDVLHVDPALPDWLPDISLRDLRFGRHSLDIDFHRDGAVTAFTVTRGDAALVRRTAIGDPTGLG